MNSELSKQAPTYHWKPWKIGGCVVAGLLVLAGGVTSLFGSGGETGALPLTSGAAPGAESLLPGSTPGPTNPGPTTTEPAADVTTDEDGGVSWSPTLLKGGLSFFLAFALGYAFRMFLRIGLFFVGVWAASLFLLSSAGWVEVHWDAIDTVFESWASGLGDQFKSASAFITGSLPSAGMAGLGLVTGLKRR